MASRVVLVILLQLALLLPSLAGELRSRKGQPIFDGVDGVSQPSLQLYSCYAIREKLWGPEDLRRVVSVQESWDAKDGATGDYRRVVIARWRLKRPEQAVILPEYLALLGSYGWPGWGLVANEVGDRTLWIGHQRVIFAYGSTLVHLKVGGDESRYGESYVRGIAERIKVRLQSVPNDDDSLCPYD